MQDKDYWIKRLALTEHPEGGYFHESYRSSGRIPEEALPPEFVGSRSYCTAIYYLLDGESYSAFHRIKQDEIWHYYAGSSLTIHILSRGGHYGVSKLGLNFEAGQQPQVTVGAGKYFAAEVDEKDSFCLVGCTVAPGFQFEDFEMPKKATLRKLFPEYSNLIERLTRE